jgi:hypothetical protein
MKHTTSEDVSEFASLGPFDADTGVSHSVGATDATVVSIAAVKSHL